MITYRPARRTWVLAVGLVLSLSACNRERNESIKLMNQGIDRFERGDVAGAMALLNESAMTDPKNDRALYHLGLIQYQRGAQEEAAAETLKKAIEVNGENADYYYHLGQVESRLERWGPAINSLEKAIAKKQNHAESHYRLGVALEKQARFDRAQEEYIEAIKLKPRFPEAYNALGNLYARFEKYPQASQVFKNAIENNPEEATNYNDLGLVYQRLQRFDEAISQFLAATKLKPTYTSALFNLGMAYATNDHAEQAVQYLKLYLARRTAAEDATRVRTAEDTIARIEARAAAAALPSTP